MTTDTKPAEQLETLDRLADGAIVWHLSFQLNWIYARAMKQCKFVVRRYRYGQAVKVMDE